MELRSSNHMMLVLNLNFKRVGPPISTLMSSSSNLQPENADDADNAEDVSVPTLLSSASNLTRKLIFFKFPRTIGVTLELSGHLLTRRHDEKTRTIYLQIYISFRKVYGFANGCSFWGELTIIFQIASTSTLFFLDCHVSPVPAIVMQDSL